MEKKVMRKNKTLKTAKIYLKQVLFKEKKKNNLNFPHNTHGLKSTQRISIYV